MPWHQEPKKDVDGCDKPRLGAEQPAHRQDSKSTWWTPWHQEPKKDVDGCDKPRLGAEQPLTRGSPNGKTQRW